MAKQYKRDANGKFASAGVSKGAGKSKPVATKQPAKPKRTAGQKAALVAGTALGVAAVAGGLKVNNTRVAALARYEQRAADAAIRRMTGGR